MINRNGSSARPRGIHVTGHRVRPGSAATGEFSYFVVKTNSVPASSIEHRREKRMRTRLRDGLIADRRLTVTCHIRDRSKQGARLHIDDDNPLPRVFILTDAASKARFTATLVWQRGRDAGVRLRPIDVR